MLLIGGLVYFLVGFNINSYEVNWILTQIVICMAFLCLKKFEGLYKITLNTSLKVEIE